MKWCLYLVFIPLKREKPRTPNGECIKRMVIPPKYGERKSREKRPRMGKIGKMENYGFGERNGSRSARIT